MKLSEGLRIAFKEMTSKKIRFLLTTLGVIIGVASVISLVSIGEGVKSYISGQIEALGSNLVIVTPSQTGITGGSIGGTVSSLTYPDAQAVAQQAKSVRHVVPVIESGSTIIDGKSTTSLINGTVPEYPEIRNFKVAQGRFFQSKELKDADQVVVLGSKVARRLFNEERPINQKVTINNQQFTIIGVMLYKGRTLTIDNDDRVFIPITTAEKMLKTNRLSMIFLQARNSDAVDSVVHQTKEILQQRKVKSFAINEQKDLLNAFDGIMRTLTGMLGGIASISLLVGGIGIMNIMLVSVTERTREIGVRKAVGAKRRDILLQFLLESIMVSSIGGMLGILMGVVSARFLPNVIPDLPITVVTPWSIIISFSFSLLVGLFFGIYPARKAAGLDPIVALRYE